MPTIVLKFFFILNTLSFCLCYPQKIYLLFYFFNQLINFVSVGVVVRSLTIVYIELLMKILGDVLEESRHIAFYSLWVTSALKFHGQMLKQRAPSILSILNTLQKSLANNYENLDKM